MSNEILLEDKLVLDSLIKPLSETLFKIGEQYGFQVQPVHLIYTIKKILDEATDPTEFCTYNEILGVLAFCENLYYDESKKHCKAFDKKGKK